MRTSPEKLIARLRNHKGRIIAHSILAAIFLAMLTVSWWVLLTIASDTLLLKKGEDPVFHLTVTQPMTLGIATLTSMSFLFASLVGVFGGALVEFTGLTKDDLLVQLWDRVQALEKSVGNNTNDFQSARGS
jgi:hypothetical protein